MNMIVDSFKIIFWMKNLIQRWTQTGAFFSKSGHFFQFSKTVVEASPLPIAECLSVWLNMHWYPWICLNILENPWINCSNYACSQYAWSSYMFDRLLKMPQALNKPGFWVWHGFKCKGYAEFRIFLIMAQQ